MKKIVFLVVVTLFLNGCFQMVAYMGPAITGVTGGNITHSALSYGLSYSVKKATGKTPIEQVISLTKEKQERDKNKEKQVIARNKEKQAKARKIVLLNNLLSQHLETVVPVLSAKNKEEQVKAKKIGLLSNLLSQHLETVAPVLSTKN